MSTVRMKYPDRVAFLCQRLMEDGVGHLHVISDFDDTFTKTHSDGKRCHDSFGIINHTTLAPEGFLRNMKTLKDTFLPIEHDPELSEDEKIPFMVEWWTRSLETIAEAGFTEKELADMVRTSTAKLRDGCAEFMKTLRDSDVPLFIFSAGIGDVIEEILRQQSEMLPNVQVVSNYLSSRGGVIHSFNKIYASHLAKNESYVAKTADKKNIIMMGDLLGDLKMIEGAEDGTRAVLKIGFYNHVNSNDDKFQEYMDKFDVVLVKDQTLDIVNVLIDKIISYNY